MFSRSLQRYKITSCILLFSMCLTLVSCKADSIIPPQLSPIENSTSTEYEKNDKQQETSQPTPQDRKVVDSHEEYDASDLPLIASIPDQNIYLYGIKPTGTVLNIRDTGLYFDWAYITPRFILPQMMLSDFDSDQQQELSVVLYVGSGTGYAVEELHVLEIEETLLKDETAFSDEYVVPSQRVKDHMYQPEKYLTELSKAVKLKVQQQAEAATIDIYIGKDKYNVSLKDLLPSEGKIHSKPSFGDVVYFYHDKEKLSAKFGLGITSTGYAAPFFIGYITADVTYGQGNFSLSNLRFEHYEEFI